MLTLRKGLLAGMLAALFAFGAVACEEAAEDPDTEPATEDPAGDLPEEEDPMMEDDDGLE